jgi:hypothetical protein
LWNMPVAHRIQGVITPVLSCFIETRGNGHIPSFPLGE